MAAEIKRTVSDINVLSLGFVFDTSSGPAKASLICLLHYINKLETTYNLLKNGDPISDISKVVYRLVSRDSLESLMTSDEEPITKESLQYIND